MSNLVLDAKGWVFWDVEIGGPTWCALWEGRPWLFDWDKDNVRWHAKKSITMDTVKCLPHNMDDSLQQIYHDMHLRCLSRVVEGD